MQVGGVLPDLRTISSVPPDLRVISSVTGSRSSSLVCPSSEHCSPEFPGREYESSPVMPGDLRVPVNRKPKDIATHLEVMAVIHTESGLDGSSSDNGMPEPSPTPNEEGRDDMNSNQGWTIVSCKGRRLRQTSREKWRCHETLDVKLDRAVREAERHLTPDDHVRINK